MTASQAGVATLVATVFLEFVALGSARNSGVVLAFGKPVALGISVASVVLAVTLARTIGFGLPTVFLLSLAAVNAITDIQSGLCFDNVHLWVACALTLSRHASVGQAATGLLAGTVVLGTLYLLTATKGIGLGDIKFAATMGLGLGVSGEAQALYAAFVAGGAAAACMLLFGRAHRKAAIAFAPFLSFGTVCALVASPTA